MQPKHHACQRALERYGVDLALVDLIDFRRQIIDGRARQCGDNLFQVWHRASSSHIIVAYDSQAKRVLTSVPKTVRSAPLTATLAEKLKAAGL